MQQKGILSDDPGGLCVQHREGKLPGLPAGHDPTHDPHWWAKQNIQPHTLLSLQKQCQQGEQAVGTKHNSTRCNLTMWVGSSNGSDQQGRASLQ